MVRVWEDMGAPGLETVREDVRAGESTVICLGWRMVTDTEEEATFEKVVAGPMV